MKSNKTNIAFLSDNPFNHIKHCNNNRMYLSENGALKEEYGNSSTCNVEEVFEDKLIDLSFNVKEYFKINTKIEPWADPSYLSYFNNWHVNIPNVELEHNDDIIITLPVNNNEDIFICYETPTQCGAYKTVMKYNCSRIIEELDCELWAPLDIRKPFKLVKKNKLKKFMSTKKEDLIKEINERVIGEVKQEFAHWYVYHPVQLRKTLERINFERSEIQKMKKDFLQKRALMKLNRECLKLKEIFFEYEEDEKRFLKDFAQFW